MLKLRKYLNSEGINANVFARKIGFSPSYMYKIFTEGLLPSLTAAIRIEEQTRGHVSVYDWEIDPKEKKNKKSNKKSKKQAKADQTEICVVPKP